jgi:hypothetical protein
VRDSCTGTVHAFLDNRNKSKARMNAIDLFEDAETTNLTLTRVANFYNGTVRVLMKAMHGHCLISYQDLSDGNLRLNRKSCERPISEEPLFPDDTPDNVRMASTCFSWCCDAIVAGTGILALFAQGMRRERILDGTR